tara:strand:+ start:1779 stop:3686 length:1908 start_codon:yes stop_codon:yes gene_type:complete
MLTKMSSNAQDTKEKKAETSFENYAYSEAINSYENLVNQGFSSEEIFKNLGNANYFNANYKEAAEWYGKLMEVEGVTIDSEYLYKYAQTLKSLEKYKESDIWMLKFESAKNEDNRSKLFIQHTDYIHKIKKNSGRYNIKNSTINSSVSDFAPSINGSQLIFSSARDSGITTKNIHKWNSMPFLDLYIVSISESGAVDEPIPFSKNINKRTHESSTAFTKDGQTIYFTRNNSTNGSFDRDKEGISRLKIYKAILVNNQWKNITELPFNSDNYSVAHPTLSPDETKLYFASDMPGTLGASDIFMVTINKDGTYGTPENLGPSINTEARETFPFVTNSNKLYFASDGHPGLGGLDIFAIDLETLAKGYIQNVGTPVNSEEDDFSFIIDENSNIGYFASNRKNGKGGDDIYNFTENDPLNFTCKTIVTGLVKDRKMNSIIQNAKLVIRDKKGKTISNGVSDTNGYFSLSSECINEEYVIYASKTDYEEGSTPISIKNEYDTNNIIVFLTSTLEEAEKETDLAIQLNLKPIYFDFDKSLIRKDDQVVLAKVVSYLKQYPNTNIQIGSHTDARANDSYNLKLSKRRAKATLEYLITQGISASRLSSEGYGETKLTNNCDNNTKCSNEKHQVNRRSEFIVIK